MSIRFRCQRCNQLLGIASRKAGTEIECPKCGESQTVPSEEAAAVALAMSHFARQVDTAETSPGVVAYDDQPTPIDGPLSGELIDQELPGPTSGPPANLGSPFSRDRDVVVYPRQTLYLQAVLFLALAVVAFAAGYFMGRGDAMVARQRAAEEASRELVLVEGKVVFDPGDGTLEGDQGAVVIGFPDGKTPGETLSIQGIRPQDPPPAEDHPSVRAIEELGGAFAKADTTGAFSMVLPGQGKYRLLIVSYRTDRAADQPIDELDLDQIRRYFYRAGDLIGRHKYRWSREEFRPGDQPVTQNFGPDEGETAEG